MSFEQSEKSDGFQKHGTGDESENTERILNPQPLGQEFCHGKNKTHGESPHSRRVARTTIQQISQEKSARCSGQGTVVNAKIDTKDE